MSQGHKDSSGSLFPHHHVKAPGHVWILEVWAQKHRRLKGSFKKRSTFLKVGVRSLIFLAQTLGGSQLC